jgi:hypothetical protein
LGNLFVLCRSGLKTLKSYLRSSSQKNFEFRHSIPPDPLISFVPLNRSIRVDGTTKEPGDIFHSQQMVAFHCRLEDFGIISASLSRQGSAVHPRNSLNLR